MKYSSQLGVTLIELMVVVALIGVVASMASASMGLLVPTDSTASYKQNLVNSLNLAKSEAVSRNTRVTVCQRAAGATLACAKGDTWNNGWIMFVDVDNNGVINKPAADPNLNIIHVQGPLRGNFNIQGNGQISELVSFSRLGFPRNPTTNAIQMGTFTICGPLGYNIHSRKISIASTGRVKVRAPSVGEAEYNGVGDSTCPAG